jgi:hypothetical protein
MTTVIRRISITQRINGHQYPYVRGVSEGFQRGFRGVSEGFQRGFRGVSEGFNEEGSIKAELKQSKTQTKQSSIEAEIK